MKRTMKKHLSLVLAVLMLLTCAGFNVIAAGECRHVIAPGNPTYQKVVNPTCTEQGYTIYYCTLCSDVEKGEMVEVSRDVPTAPLGHQYGDYEYEAVTAEIDGESVDAFSRVKKCTRHYYKNGTLEACTAKSVEMDGETPVLYHSVTFINNRITKDLDPTITYTSVAMTYSEEELHSCYVKRGDAVAYEGTINPFRQKTKEYGSYSCIGWTENAYLEATAENNLDAEDCTDLSSVEKNLVLYPVFRGELEKYLVTFYDLEGENLTWPKEVEHGGNPQFSDPAGNLYPDPEKEADIANYYSFAGWVADVDQAEPIPTDIVESVSVYGTMHFYPAFTSVPKNYTVEFYNETATNLLATVDGVHFGDSLIAKEDVQKINREDVLAKASDETYYYIWTGKWRVLAADGSNGSNLDLNNFRVTLGDFRVATDEEGNTVMLPNSSFGEEKKVVRLVPVYERRLKVYAVDVEMLIPHGEDEDYYRGEAEVQVIANNGQLVASGKTDANGKFRCYLNYQIPFTVNIATYDGKYLGSNVITGLFSDTTGNINNEAEINKCSVAMQLNPDYETHCRCIHHNALLQPIFVRILNLLYTFFNVKYVCCYDMYSTIGPLLDYTAG